MVDLSAAQDVEAGDGTTTVVVIAGSLLVAAIRALDCRRSPDGGVSRIIRRKTNKSVRQPDKFLYVFKTGPYRGPESAPPRAVGPGPR